MPAPRPDGSLPSPEEVQAAKARKKLFGRWQTDGREGSVPPPRPVDDDLVETLSEPEVEEVASPVAKKKAKKKRS